MVQNMMKKFFDWLFIIAGTVLTAFSFSIFFIPHEIAPGGVSGIATILHVLFDFPVGVGIILINLPLFIMGWHKYGVRFMLGTFVSTILMSLIIDLVPIPEWLLDGISSDMLLSCIYGGVMMGAGLGLVLRCGATTGGTDLAAMLLNSWFPHIRVAWILFAIDFIVVAAAGIFFEPMMALYAIITLFISARAMDFVQVGINSAKALMIISDHAAEISDGLLNKVGRGVTMLPGKGMYSGNEKNVLLCVVRRNEIAKSRMIIKNIDDRAFVIVSNVSEVLGEGFSANKI